MKFIIDKMLGKSAKYLRMLGYDTIYPPPKVQQELINQAVQENRYIITRSSKLYQNDSQAKILLLSSNDFTTRFQKIAEELNIQIDDDKIFSRCLQCNFPLQNINKSKIKARLPQKVKSNFHHFTFCPNCDKIYWRGGHTERMLNKIKLILGKD
ncbi:MAG TPA: Mut7-C RNAse domain-containing protein [bacterium]|nr:Mut7-C RNAse domain-containing protein [bacterium]